MIKNTLSRTVTGSAIIIFALWFIIFIGFIDGPGFDFSAVIFGALFLILGIVIFFNKKEDELEKIKDQNK
jgi:hypothetical protein